jgi:hypothetical protein
VDSTPFTSAQIPQESSRGPQAMDSSPFDAPTQRRDAYLATPCPLSRNKSYPSRGHSEKPQRTVRGPAGADSASHDKDDDRSDVVLG